MAKSYEVDVWGHNSIYIDNYLKDNYKKRRFKVYFSVPDDDISEETGILLLIPGFGGHANSNVYKKMRNEFADKYNLVTIQCDYFGWEFMQSDLSDIIFSGMDIECLKKSLSGKEFVNVYSDNVINYENLLNSTLSSQNVIKFKKHMNESLDNFCDMGVMQAIDNITATLFVMNTIYNNNKVFNTKRVIIMGQSHGSYLGYLCNYLCEDLYTSILDNSAWIYPQYLKKNRILSKVDLKNSMLVNVIEFQYLAREEGINFDFLDLSRLYTNYDNNCNIVVYHGSNDSLISYEEKFNKLKFINNINFNYIDDKAVDGCIFKDTNHGLGADFIKLFDNFFKNNIKDNKDTALNFKNSCSIKGYNIEINYSNNIPIINCY